MLVSTLLFPEYRKRVLGLLLLHPTVRYHLREIARLTNTTPGTLHRELLKLVDAKILIRDVSGKQVYYQANDALPVFNELANILRKTSGLVDILTNALMPLAEKIKVALVFGSIGRGMENERSDVDVLIIGDIGFKEAVVALYSAQETIGREINPKVYNKIEWNDLLHKKDPFVQEILNNPKLFLIGESSGLK